MRPDSIRMFSPALMAAAALSCADAAPSTVTLQDSAGVPVVLNASLDLRLPPSWSVADDPLLAVGELAGPTEYNLFRVSGATFLSNGNLVIGNRGTHELRFFDGSGRYIRSSGGQGNGPGEFEYISAVYRSSGDTILVFETLRKRVVSVFDSAGTYVRRFTQPSEFGGYPVSWGALGNGTILVATAENQEPDPRPDYSVHLLDTRGAGATTLGTFPDEEYTPSGAPVIFGNRLHLHAAASTIAVANDDAFSIRLFDPGGALTRIIRLDGAQVPVEPVHYDRWRDEHFALTQDTMARVFIEQQLAESPRVDYFPAFSAVHVDLLGHVWVQRFLPPGTNRSAWLVFDQEGFLAATVELPGGLDPIEIGRDYVMGISRDQLDTEQVRVYRLDRTPR